jgi:hypothetical protein
MSSRDPQRVPPIDYAGSHYLFLDVTVRENDRNTGFLRGHDRRYQRLFLARSKQDHSTCWAIMPLTGNLFGGRSSSIGVDELPAALGGL